MFMDLMLIVVYGVGLVSGLWTGLLISKLVRIESRLRSIEKRLTTMRISIGVENKT